MNLEVEIGWLRLTEIAVGTYYSISIAKTNIHISLITKPITVKKKDRNAPDEGMRQSKDLKVPGKGKR